MGNRVPSTSRQPSGPRPRVLVVSDGALRRMRLPRSLRRAGLDAPYGADPLRLDAELRRGGWDLLVWAGGRDRIAREALSMPGAPPVLLVMDATRGAAGVAAAHWLRASAPSFAGRQRARIMGAWDLRSRASGRETEMVAVAVPVFGQRRGVPGAANQQRWTTA